MSTPRTDGRSRSGCLTALYIVLGLGAFMLIATIAAGWMFIRSETGQRVIQTAREGINLTREAALAPGTEALRANGCDQAMVMPVGRMLELLGRIAPDARKAAGRLEDDTMVLCQLHARRDEPPDCADVARIYGAAAPNAPERFAVMVQQPGERNPVCQGSYARDGSQLDDRPFERQEPAESADAPVERADPDALEAPDSQPPHQRR